LGQNGQVIRLLLAIPTIGVVTAIRLAVLTGIFPVVAIGAWMIRL
jgi:hypothetical protein